MSTTGQYAGGAPPDSLAERFIGRDGLALCVRPLGPADVASERAFMEGLSPESMYRRLLGMAREVSDAELAAWLQQDWPRGVALAIYRSDAPAATRDGPDASREIEIFGVARFAASRQPQVGEFAIVVADAWQQRGLGYALFERLIRAARAAGYRQLVGTTFADSRRMIDLARSLGCVASAEEGEPTLRRLTLTL